MINGEITISLGVVQDECDRLLIVRRKIAERLSDGSLLAWAFPGGKVELHETSEATAIREVHEETGYYVEPLKFICSGLHAINKKVHVSYYHLRPLAYDPFAEKDPVIEEARWVDLDRLGDYFSSPVNDKVAEYLGIETDIENGRLKGLIAPYEK